MNILDEIEQEATKVRETQCKTCRWLKEMPDDLRAQWEEALGDPTRMTAHIYTVANRHGLLASKSSVANHRGGHPND